MTAQPDNDCHSETFVSKMDPSYLSKGPAVNRVDADERKQALKELARRKRFEMHNVGSMRGRPPE
jgi:hypothetical protein